MKIVCESCGAKYSIADEKVAGKVFKIRCKKCSAVIVVKGDQPVDGAEAAREFDYGGDAVWHVVVAGEQQGPFAPRQIGELLAEGKIDWEAYVWREGMEGWQPAKDVETLVKSVMAEAEGGEAKTTVGASLSGEVFGGSNDMGADPFASSSDDGGLSGVIGQQVASATAAGGGADLFADSSRSAFAAAAADEDDAHPGSSVGGPRVAGDAALTGQRNENSVLFSLSNLQALATGSSAAPSAGRPKPGMAQGEGSGLIDIRALASATQAVADKPVGSPRDKVEDLLAVGSSNTGFSATSLAAPVATESSDNSRTMLYVMAAAIALLGAAVLYLVVRPSPQSPVAQITPSDKADQNTDEERLQVPAAVAAAGSTDAPTEAPQAAEPAPPAAANDGPSEDSDKSERSSDDDDKSDRGSARARRHAERAEKEKEKEKPSTKAEPVAAVEPATKKPSSSGDKSLDDLLDTALGGKKPAAAAKPAPSASDNLAATPSREDVLGAMKGISSSVSACGGGQSGVAMAKVGVTGATGKVSSVDVSGQFAGTPIASCVAKEVRKAKFPKFSQSTFSFSYPFKI